VVAKRSLIVWTATTIGGSASCEQQEAMFEREEEARIA
jgi:hypothetical protein